MRKIKFRAWFDKGYVTSKPAMYKVQGIHFDRTAFEVYYKIGGGALRTHRMRPDEPLMQFTGLKDKNGKEIYEFDVVKWKSWRTGEMRLWVCIFNERFASFVLQPIDNFTNKEENKTIQWSGIFVGRAKFVEIIGNVHENPELLEEK